MSSRGPMLNISLGGQAPGAILLREVREGPRAYRGFPVGRRVALDDARSPSAAMSWAMGCTSSWNLRRVRPSRNTWRTSPTSTTAMARVLTTPTMIQTAAGVVTWTMLAEPWAQR